VTDRPAASIGRESMGHQETPPPISVKGCNKVQNVSPGDSPTAGGGPPSPVGPLAARHLFLLGV
jgi:hypothetical protein